jgi:ABC-type multidrug transport system fused ATPase/permease subunit
LACARVFLRDPGILILDEATSRLDTATEALLERAVTRLLAGRTALIIAHRLSTLRRVDELLLIEDGEVVERGFREELENDPDSRFAQLLRSESREVLS